MTGALTVIIGPIDDIPVLLTATTRLGLAELADQHFKPYGNWRELRPGRVLTGWLVYIMNEVPAPFAGHRGHILRQRSARVA